MADIFFSYSRADAARVKQLAMALAENGWSVWWDRSIPPGSSFDEVIETELNAARCVVVLWSRSSITSGWVKEEAEEGLQRGVLTPVMVDDARPPLGFRRVQAADLADWDGDRSHQGYRQLLDAVHALLDGTATIDAEAPSTPVQSPPDADAAPPVEEADAVDTRAGPAASSSVDLPAAPPSTSASASGKDRPRWPLWLGPLGALTAVAGVYLTLNWSLARDADTLIGRVEALSRQPPIRYVATQPSLPPSPVKEGDYLVTALAKQLASGAVTLQFSDAQAAMVLSSDALFGSGRASLEELSRPVLAHIGQVLADWPHRPVVVTAHTDNVPIRSLQFPSNQALSAARAEAVADILRQQPGSRTDVRAKGRGDAEPLTDNATPANRARNRRIEIRVPLR